MKVDCYRLEGKKKILRLGEVSKEEELAFIATESNGFVEDEHFISYNIEELENVKDIRPEPEYELDYEITAGGEILENSDRELSGIDTDNSELGTECDN